MTRSRLCVALLMSIWIFTSLAGVSFDAASTAIVLRLILPDAYKPFRINVDSRGTLYLLSPADHAVFVREPSGGVVRRIGSIGNGPGELLNPADVSVTRDGAVWVVDKGNNRLQCFDPNGHVTSQIKVPSPLSAAVAPSGELYVVAAFDRSLVRVYDQAGGLKRQIGQPVSLVNMPPAQEAYLSRGRVYSTPKGLYYLFRSLAGPKILALDPSGKLLGEITIESSVLTHAVDEAVKTEDALRKDGGFHYSGTLNGMAVDPARGVLWVCPSAPVLLAYSLNTGRKLCEYEMTVSSVQGLKVALQDLVVKGDVGYGIVANLGVVAFSLPTVPKPTS